MKRILPFALSVLAVGALAASPSFAATSMVVHSPSSGSNYVAYTDLKTPTSAQSFCALKGGHLAVLNTNAEVLEVQKLMNLDTSDNYWLGTQALVGSNSYSNVTTQGFYQNPAFTYYLPSLPASTDLFLKAVVTSSSPSLYFSAESSSSAYFVCEFEDAPI